jgi:hypothetical protein
MWRPIGDSGSNEQLPEINVKHRFKLSWET